MSHYQSQPGQRINVLLEEIKTSLHYREISERESCVTAGKVKNVYLGSISEKKDC